MIAKRIDKDPNLADNFSHLGKYLAAADEPGEKLHELWITNCDAGETLEDLDGALAEIEATRKLNDRTSTNKTYHLVVSFRPGEGEKLTKDQLKDIERSYAEALGFSDHQRIAATHQNTDHFHMHIAINKVHPKTLKIHTPFKDFVALEKTSRALEKKYGLSVDRGLSDRGDGQAKINQAARDFEAHTWQQSFQSFMIEHRDELLKGLATAKNWQDAHATLAGFGVEIAQRGNGLVFKQMDGKQAMKASQLDRSCSKSALEGRLGAYEPNKADQGRKPVHGPEIGSGAGVKQSTQPSKAIPAVSSRPRYEAKPLTNHPATAELWRRFLNYRPPRQPKASSLLGRFAANWKTWLYMEAYKDPAAIVIIMFYKELFGMFETRKQPDLLPAPVRKAVKDVGIWVECKQSPWASWIPRLSKLSSGIKRDDDGDLAIPFRSIDGGLWGVRMVSPDGRRKKDLGDFKVSGLMHLIDPDRQLDKKPVIMTSDEGLAAALLSEAQHPVVLVPDPASVAEVAKALRGNYPNIHLMAMSPAGSAAAPKLDPSIQVTEAPKTTSAKALRKTLADLASRKKSQAHEQEQSQEMP